MGLEQAKQYAKQLHDQALNALAHFEGQAEELTQITQFCCIVKLIFIGMQYKKRTFSPLFF